jgi:hypothetical protein
MRAARKTDRIETRVPGTLRIRHAVATLATALT